MCHGMIVKKRVAKVRLSSKEGFGWQELIE
jgi:hypothetical protein